MHAFLAYFFRKGMLLLSERASLLFRSMSLCSYRLGYLLRQFWSYVSDVFWSLTCRVGFGVTFLMFSVISWFLIPSLEEHYLFMRSCVELQLWARSRSVTLRAPPLAPRVGFGVTFLTFSGASLVASVLVLRF